MSKGAKYDYEVNCHRRRDIGCLQTRITLLQALQGSHVLWQVHEVRKISAMFAPAGAQSARWQLVHCSVVHALLKQALLIAHFSMSLLCTAARASQRIANQGISHHGIVPTLHASPLASHRRQQLPTRRHVCSATEDGADLDQQLQADLERVRQRQATAAPSPAAQQATSAAQRAANSKGDGPLAGVKDAVDKLLIADFFFILFALGWLGAGLAERSALQSTVGRQWRCCALLYCMLLLHLCVCARVPR